MSVHNGDVADMLNELADIFYIRDADSFRVCSHRDAARTLSGLSGDVSEMVMRGEDLSYEGVATSRRAWLEAPDLINTRWWTELQSLLSRT